MPIYDEPFANTQDRCLCAPGPVKALAQSDSCLTRAPPVQDTSGEDDHGPGARDAGEYPTSSRCICWPASRSPYLDDCTPRLAYRYSALLAAAVLRPRCCGSSQKPPSFGACLRADRLRKDSTISLNRRGTVGAVGHVTDLELLQAMAQSQELPGDQPRRLSEASLSRSDVYISSPSPCSLSAAAVAPVGAVLSVCPLPAPPTLTDPARGVQTAAM